MSTDTRMLEEPDLFLSLNTCHTGNRSIDTCHSTGSTCGTIKRDGTLRHTCAGSTIGSVDSRSVKSRVFGINVGDIKARKWYLVVILLLYIGLITSFCLNISLLLRTYPKQNESLQTMPSLKSKGILQDKIQDPASSHSSSSSSKREYVYSTACLVEDPCEAGSYYSCSARSCLPCEVGTFQPVWGQTSCWSCPPNTTTDTMGSSAPTQCKHQACVHHSRPGLAILQSPNYPGSLPATTNCHWRVSPGQGVSVLLILPTLSLPPDCSHTLSVRRGANIVFTSCQNTEGPILLTSQGSGEMWVDFRSSSSNKSLHVDHSSGFQLSLVSVTDDMRHLIDTVTNTYNEYNDNNPIKSLVNSRHNNMADQQLVRHIIKLLSAKVGGNDKVVKATAADLPKISGEHSLITVVEENEHEYPYVDNDQYA